MFCTQCGGQLAKNDRFCSQCGAPVNNAPQPSSKKNQQTSSKAKPSSNSRGKISVQQILQDPEAQPFVEPLQNICTVLADRITDNLPFVYFAQFLNLNDLLTEAGQGFENGEFEQTDYLLVFGSVLENADFSDAMDAYRQMLNDFPAGFAAHYNYLIQSLVDNGVDDSILQYALDDDGIKREADKIHTALAKPAADAAKALKALVAAYPNLMKLLQQAKIDFDHLQASQETMEDSDLWSYARGIIAFTASPALGALSLLQTYNRSSEKTHRAQDKVANEIETFNETLQGYIGDLFNTFDQLHQTALEQFNALTPVLTELYAKPFLLAKHVGAIEDWETLGDGANALIGEGIYGGFIEEDDESFDEIVARSREFIQTLREELE